MSCLGNKLFHFYGSGERPITLQLLATALLRFVSSHCEIATATRKNGDLFPKQNWFNKAVDPLTSTAAS